MLQVKTPLSIYHRNTEDYLGAHPLLDTISVKNITLKNSSSVVIRVEFLAENTSGQYSGGADLWICKTVQSLHHPTIVKRKIKKLKTWWDKNVKTDSNFWKDIEIQAVLCIEKSRV